MTSAESNAADVGAGVGEQGAPPAEPEPPVSPEPYADLEPDAEPEPPVDLDLHPDLELRAELRVTPGITVLTGGQTGVDTLAARAALSVGLPVHMVFPHGFRQEDGPLTASAAPNCTAPCCTSSRPPVSRSGPGPA
jgi:hypothetical protein